MHQRNVLGTFFPMHSNVAHFHLHVEWNNVEAANLCAASGDPLDFGDHPPAHKGLKGIRSGVPQRSQESDYADSDYEEQKFPPARRSGGRLSHRVCTPSPAPVEPGTLNLLSERKDCSHETSNSLTFS